ncbi:uncharacterized protein LOC120781752 isoform X2 [Bactrocera tryoni]|uniref:uncharacterized protein LOC120781752 isoform X2 n=1 Tax=Bactrocera tryoni TaxID=59916 RepID=UPI001A96ACC4|nr:uncharacterized protein LOC120781752 isoform X2 [Bactrocera tryoni]
MATSNGALTFTLNKIIKDAHCIREYKGDNSCALTSFLREVDMVLTFFPTDSPEKTYVFHRIIINKIQGEALHVVRTLGPSPTWIEIFRRTQSK